MSFVGIVSLFVILGLKLVASASVSSINPNSLASSTVLDASPTSNSLRQHLASIARTVTPLSKINTTISSVALNPSQTVNNASDGDSNNDLKTDSSTWYRYNRYRYYPYYRSSYYPYSWLYDHYNHPFYQHQYRYTPYNYYNQYYTGQYYYNPYRPQRPLYHPELPSYRPKRPAYRPYRPSYRPYRPSYTSPYRRPYSNYYFQ